MGSLFRNTRPSRRRSNNARLGRPRYTMTGRDHDPAADPRSRPGGLVSAPTRRPGQGEDHSPTPTEFPRPGICWTYAHRSFPTDTVGTDRDDRPGTPARYGSGEQVEQIRESTQVNRHTEDNASPCPAHTSHSADVPCRAGTVLPARRDGTRTGMEGDGHPIPDDVGFDKTR